MSRGNTITPTNKSSQLGLASSTRGSVVSPIVKKSVDTPIITPTRSPQSPRIVKNLREDTKVNPEVLAGGNGVIVKPQKLLSAPKVDKANSIIKPKSATTSQTTAT